jgi:hypothetical protein
MLIRNIIAALLLSFPMACVADDGDAHPLLLLSEQDVQLVSGAPAIPPAFEAAIESAKMDVDRYLEVLPDVPVPKDAGGGYTHEQHKRNSTTIQNAGILYQLTGNKAYAELAKNILLAYADLYPTLSDHPQQKNQSPGQLFWQSLNEAVWLVTTIQGYDAIYTSIDQASKDKIENQLLRPMVSFISDEAPQTFDRIHNHGTWAVAAVGMTGYVLGDEDYVEKALYGLKRDGKSGFLKQIDVLFSPDGFYSEGPYYQRYALMPFLLFAKVIERNEPERKIFEHRDGVLLKAVYTVIQLSYSNYFLPINDAIKDKGLDTIELCYGVAIAFNQTGDTSLLGIAQVQDRIVLTGDGFRMAQAIYSGRAKPFQFKSIQLGDGPDGSQGALSILRSNPGPKDQALVFKATGQGLGHGHFDKLTWLFYDNGNEIVSDYGAARFLNVEEKDGGRYLLENKTWAKQTVAHNTLVVDETSHFDGDWKLSQKFHPENLIFDVSDDLKIVSASMDDAYEGVSFTRTLAMIKDEGFSLPVTLDVLEVSSDSDHQYDLPLHFKGQVTHVSHPLEASTTSMSALGDKNGYQHLWLRARAQVNEGEVFQVTWLLNNRFYTYSVLADKDMEVLFTQTGANDPNFNLRTEPGLILRVKSATKHKFISVLEPHGEYNGSREFTTASASHIKSIQQFPGENADVIGVYGKTGSAVLLGLSPDSGDDKTHTLEAGGRPLKWTGSHRLFKEEKAHE